ncbi:site-specific integrase [Gammaproteobacteria bacterium]|nr:site-specific integrase [Gammaproteobacteria bacterium]
MIFRPILDGIDTVAMPIDQIYPADSTAGVCLDDLKHTRVFLAAYSGSKDTFVAYRRDIERLLLWLWFVRKGTLQAMTREDVSQFIVFATTPPKSWVSEQVCHRYLDGDMASPNQKWRPFAARGKPISEYRLSNASIKSMMAIVSTFLTFLVQEQYLVQNVMLLVRQKNRFVSKAQESIITRKLTNTMWCSVIDAAMTRAENGFEGERNLFILSAFYLMGLRISELSVTDRRMPMMGDFVKDDHGCYWFSVVGKGNKYREIAVCDQMLSALSRYRQCMGLRSMPLRSEQTLLLPKVKGRGGLGSRQIRFLVMGAFQEAVDKLRERGDNESADDLSAATVHWLRHTAISQDVQNRPAEHVRDDAGHENITVTDRYINVSRQHRHQSAKFKQLIPGAEK